MQSENASLFKRGRTIILGRARSAAGSMERDARGRWLGEGGQRARAARFRAGRPEASAARLPTNAAGRRQLSKWQGGARGPFRATTRSGRECQRV